jgi:hypothetical protein
MVTSGMPVEGDLNKTLPIQQIIVLKIRPII